MKPMDTFDEINIDRKVKNRSIDDHDRIVIAREFRELKEITEGTFILQNADRYGQGIVLIPARIGVTEDKAFYSEDNHSVEKVDGLGRVTLQRELMVAFDFRQGDELLQLRVDDGILLMKHKPGCGLCGGLDEKQFDIGEDRRICLTCAAKARALPLHKELSTIQQEGPEAMHVT